jgi:hypothetical protein
VSGICAQRALAKASQPRSGGGTGARMRNNGEVKYTNGREAEAKRYFALQGKVGMFDVLFFGVA